MHAAALLTARGAPAAEPVSAATAATAKSAEISEIVVNGIPFRETVLPTRLQSRSVYGLDLNVMDTPRNTTLLSATQLDTLNIQDPRAFSYLTASSYSDSSFGTPNIPRIRGQYADVFYNGMRLSFTQNGYGVPPNFDVLENIAITKGPASVVDGPGPGAGGQTDFITKRPSLARAAATASLSFDSVSNRRWTIDVGGPLVPDRLGLRVSYSGEYSDSYFTSHYLHKNAVYAALRWTPNPRYTLDFNAEINAQTYTENVGVNRVSQNLIDRNLYLQGAPDGNECFSTFAAPCLTPAQGAIPIGSPATPFAPIAPILTEVRLTGAVPLDRRITLDQAPGVVSRGLTGNVQLIQSYRIGHAAVAEDNLFFAYNQSENREPYYYADASLGSWSIENRADVKLEFPFAAGGLAIKNELIFGVDFRYARTRYLSDFANETPFIYDLTTNPSLWTSSDAYQIAYAGAVYYKTSYGRRQLGVPGRNAGSFGNAGFSGLWDAAVFFQHRLAFSDAFSLLYGARLDLVRNHSFDPLGGAVCDACSSSIYNRPGVPLPQSHTTGVYGLGNANVSLLYRPRRWVSGYLTFDFTQSENPNGGAGGINAFLQVPDHVLLRSDSLLYEAGLKFDLANNKLFVGIAGFDQKRTLPVGAGGSQFSRADIRGVEIEANYQPTRRLFATAGYSYIRTTLDTPASFYNYAAEPGINIDGAGLFAVFAPGQKFDDPGVPRHVFNVLGNYKFQDGLGFRYGVQVIGPISTTTSGRLVAPDPAHGITGTRFAPASVVAAGYDYKSPVIPTQFAMNASVFYEWKKYTVTASIYNFTDQKNWQSSPAFYGNDFLVRSDPRTYEIRLQAKF